MAWSTPRTWAVGEEVTAAKMNEIRDQLVDLDRRTSPSGATIVTTETTTGTAYGNLTTVGPAVTVTIGSVGKALVAIYAALSNASANFALMSFAVSGASTVAGSDASSLQVNNTSDVRVGATVLQEALSAGVSTFTGKYRVTGGTGSWNGRRILVTPLGS